MPSADEFQELYDNCTYIYTALNGVNGILFTSNVNGNTLFLPKGGDFNGTSHGYLGSAGFYWSATWNSPTTARHLLFSGSTINPQNTSNRYYGFSVRAVLPPT